MGRLPTFITVRGVTNPLQQWAADNGLHPQSIRRRLKKGATPAEAVAKVQSRTRLITINGKTRTLAEWLRRYNRSDVTFDWRIARGDAEQDAIITPLQIRSSALPRADEFDTPLKGRAGVYSIRCKSTKRYYIGSSTNLMNTKARWSSNLKAQTKRSLPKRLLPICRNTVPTALSSASSSSVNPTAPRQGKRHCYARHKRNICVGSITLDKSPFGSGRCGRRVGKRNEKPSIKPTSAYPERSHQRRCESLTWP